METNTSVIVPVGVAVWAFISGLLVYIWRTDRGVLASRLAKLEDDKDTSLKTLIENPILTISSHAILCGDIWRHLNERLMGMESSIKKEIRIAILEALKNGQRTYDKIG